MLSTLLASVRHRRFDVGTGRNEAWDPGPILELRLNRTGRTGGPARRYDNRQWSTNVVITAPAAVAMPAATYGRSSSVMKPSDSRV